MKIKSFFKFLPTTLTLGTLFFMALSGFDGVVISQIISRITKFNKDSDLRSVFIFITIAMIAYIVVTLASFFSSILQNEAVKLWNKKVKAEYIYKHLYSGEKVVDSATAISTLTNDFKLLESKYFSLIFKVVYYTFMGIISIVYLMYLNIYLSFVFIAFAFLPMLSSLIFGKKLSQKTQDFTLASEGFVTRIKDIFKGFYTIKVYNSEKEFMNKINYSIDNLEDKSYKLENLRALSDLCSGLLSWISYIAPITVSLVFVVKGYADSSVIIAMFLACDRVIYPFRFVSVYLNQIRSTEELRNSILEKISLANSERIEVKETNKANIYFENVSFKYDDNSILENVDLKINFGEKILISGNSGVGKTTVLDLLEGISVPQKGNIIYKNDETVYKVSKSSKNRSISRIRQDVYLYNDTLKFNLTLGENFESSKIIDVLKKVGLLEELGADCLLKNYGEDGKELSGGQKQRIEIARALLFNKDILLIDEATSALDKKSSKKIREVIYNLPCTVIEVAHHYDKNDLVNKKINHYILENKQLNLLKEFI